MNNETIEVILDNTLGLTIFLCLRLVFKTHMTALLLRLDSHSLLIFSSINTWPSMLSKIILYNLKVTLISNVNIKNLIQTTSVN